MIRSNLIFPKDKTAPLYILDDNLKLRPIFDIGIEDGKILV